MSYRTFNSPSPLEIGANEKLVSIVFPSTASSINSLVTDDLETIDTTGCSDSFKSLVHNTYGNIPSITIVDNDTKGGSFETVGSIYYSDGSTTLPSEDVDNSKTPIGILVIPSSHMEDGKARIMSLAGIAENGVGSLSPDNVWLTWGVEGTDTSLHNYDQIPCIGHNGSGEYPDNVIDHVDEWGYICSNIDGWSAIENPSDPGTYWAFDKEGFHNIPSPYNADGTFNTTYNATSYSGGTINNVLSDFNGKSNTDTLVALGANYKAATACSLYSTEGTNRGDWYLPAMGELAYIMVRYQTIQNSLNKLGKRALVLKSSGSYWSSTEFSSNKAYRIISDNGSIDYGGKRATYYVRAFLQV